MSKIFIKAPLNVDIEESRRKGHQFENFIVTLFNERNFQLLEWRSDKKASNGVYPLSCTYPDLEFRSRGKGKQRFAVECKWRQELVNGGLYWAKSYQIGAYLGYQRQHGISVLVAIGIGGEPSSPDMLFVTTLDHIYAFRHLPINVLPPFNPNKRLDSPEDLQLKLF